MNKSNDFTLRLKSFCEQYSYGYEESISLISRLLWDHSNIDNQVLKKMVYQNIEEWIKNEKDTTELYTSFQRSDDSNCRVIGSAIISLRGQRMHHC